MGIKEEAAGIVLRERQQKAAAEQTADHYRSLLEEAPLLAGSGGDPREAYMRSLLPGVPRSSSPFSGNSSMPVLAGRGARRLSGRTLPGPAAGGIMSI